MKNYSAAYANEISAPCRSLIAEFQSANEHSYSTDYIKSISVEAPQVEGKLFGYSVSYKSTVVLLQKQNRVAFSKGDWFTIKLGTASQLMEFPKFYIDSIKEDAKTGEITLEGYDNVYKLNNYTFSDLNYGATFTKTITQIINNIGTLLGCTISNNGINKSMSYTQSTLNVAGDTSLRDIINNIAEVTGTILVNSGASGNNLAFKKLDNTSRLNITKSNYYDLEAGASTTLTALSSVNSVGDTVSVGNTGYTQVLCDNAFLTLLQDATIQTMLTNILNNIEKTVVAYNLDWIGNPALEYGDRVTISTKNGTIVTNYLSENLQYNGGMKDVSEWSASTETSTTATVNNSISTSLKKTEAKVDKANQEITFTVSEIGTAKAPYTTLKQKLDSIVVEAGTGNLTFRQNTVPTGTQMRSLMTGDLWFNTGASGYTVNKWYRYNGSTWEVLTDGELVTATGNITNLTITTQGLSSSVSSLNTAVSGLNTDMTQAKSDIIQNANDITARVTTSTYNTKMSQLDGSISDINDEIEALDTTVASHTSELSIQAGQIATKVAQTTYNTKMTQLDGSISTLNNDVDGLDTRVTTAESTITQHSTEISSKVSQSSYDTKMASLDGSISTLNSSVSGLDTRVTTNTSSITQQANKIALVVEENQGVNTIKAASIVTAINDSGSSVIIDADHVELNANAVTFTDLSTSGSTIINGDNITTGTINTDRLNVADIISESDLRLRVDDKCYRGSIIVNTPTGAAYGFNLGTDGWYESNNPGDAHHLTAALAKVIFTTTAANQKINFKVYNFGELNYDFCLVSRLDTLLATTNIIDDATLLTKSYKGLRVTKDSPDIIQIDVPTAGEHFIEFKYRKDNSTSTLPDKCGFKLDTSNPSSTITLSQGSGASKVDITSSNLNITGVVTFNDLEGSGKTVINGSNIETGTLSADKIYGGSITASKIILGDTESSNYIYADESGLFKSSGGEVYVDTLVVNDSSLIVRDSSSNASLISSTKVDTNIGLARQYLQAPKLVLDGGSSHYSTVYPFADASLTTYYYIWLVPDEVQAGSRNFKYRLVCTTRSDVYDSSSEVNIPQDRTFNVKLVFDSTTMSSLLKYTDTWTATMYANSSRTSIRTVTVPSGYLVLPNLQLSTYKFTESVTTGIREYGFSVMDDVIPYESDEYDLGSTNLKWHTVYATTGTIQTSDRNLKTDINPISNNYSVLFDKLQPVTYKFTDGHRHHIGLVAQDVEQAMSEADIDSEDFACLVKDVDADGNDSYGLRYEELIGLLIKEVQELKAKVKLLEGGNN